MKKMRIKYTLFCILFFFSMLSASGQNFKKDFGLVREAYDKMNSFYCEVEINVFNDLSSNIAAQKMSSVIKKRAGEYSYSLGKNKMLMNDEFILYVNEDEKQMLYTIRDKKREFKIPNQNAADMIDSLLTKTDSVVYKGMDEKFKKYILYNAKQVIVSSELWINTDNNTISRVIYNYNTDKGMEMTVKKVEIAYVNTDLAPKFADSEFSEKQYAFLSKKTIKPVGKYAGYQTTVIDQHDIK